VFTVSAVAVRVQNVLFSRGGPTSCMSLSGERLAPTLRLRK